MILIRALQYEDKVHFLNVMNNSADFHFPYANPPKTEKDFESYYQKSQVENQKTYLALNEEKEIIGVFNLSEIVRGCFQSCYLGYYASVDMAGKGLMSQALKKVLRKIFTDLKLHRVEANIQPTNTASILLAERNGFLKEGFSPNYLRINNAWCDHFRFALTLENWINSG